MASGKKKSKSKGKTLALNEFLQTDDGTVPSHVPTPAAGSSSWAAEMDNIDNEDGEELRSTFDRSKLPTAPKAARGPDIDVNSIPDNKPFTAFVGNLPYDVSEDKIAQFFEGRNLNVEGVRLPNENGRQRGFGYVEFMTKEDLVSAVSLTEEMFNGRKLRIDLAGTSGGDRDRDGSGRSDRNDWRGGGDPDRTEGDWRRRDPAPFGGNDRGGDRFSDRGDRFSDRGGDRFGDRDRFSDRGGSRGFSDRGGDSYRERRGFGDRDRDGYGDRGGGRYGDRDSGFGGRRDNGFGGRDDRYYDRRDGDRGGRFDDRRGGGFDDRRGFRNDDRRSGGDRYGGRSGYDDRGYGGRRDGYRRDDDGGGRYGGQREDRGGSRDGSQEGPRERPRLNLQPRTKPVEPPTAEESRKSSIFGSAKPVDTAAKEREIEEKLKKLDTSVHYTSEESRDSYRDSRGGGRPRRDSDRSDGSHGGGRERRLSSSSGPSRRDSDTSRQSDDSHPGDREGRAGSRDDRKMVPAPPPKENAWSKPRSEAVTRPAEPSRQMSGGSSDQDYGHREARRPSDEGRRSGYGRGSNQDNKRDRQDHKRREKQLPRSLDDLPKLEEGPVRDWADQNKYALIGSDED
ncbi:eukaryotic translation initiation factor 4B-like isoform X2 [Babylonia areolata]|uniref:eukaryotic translation initiation factor 4B-like isoform X2 n=1 Tax=Babylonia areolata TaxID=304850 RepID=UPI003FD53531